MSLTTVPSPEELARIGAAAQVAAIEDRYPGTIAIVTAEHQPQPQEAISAPAAAEPSPLWEVARDVLKEAGEPVEKGELLQRVASRVGHEVRSNALFGVLARKAQNHDTFTHPNASTYGLRKSA